MGTAEYYLRDLGTLLKKGALVSKASCAAADPTDRDFYSGRLLAYNEVLSLMVTQAAAFGLDLDTIGLTGFDPDQEL